jgi:hypothetical protein
MRSGWCAIVVVLWLSPVSEGHGQEHCEPPRVDYVTECKASVECLNKNYHDVEEQVKEVIQLSDKVGQDNLAAFRNVYELEKKYQKAFCRAYLDEQVMSWHRRGVGSPDDPEGTRKVIAASCNVKVLADFLYGLRGGFYCVEE